MKKNVTSFLFFIVIYASAFSNQKCIKNCKNHNKNTGKQVCWASINKRKQVNSELLTKINT